MGKKVNYMQISIAENTPSHEHIEQMRTIWPQTAPSLGRRAQVLS